MRSVLITGAGGGLGKALSEHFLEKGFRVIAIDQRFTGEEDLRPHMEILRYCVDVSSNDEVKLLAEKLERAGISIDILINNAGIFELYPLSEMDISHLERIISINALGAARMVREFLPDLMANRGRVIQISSESTKYPGLFQPYQISKITLEAYSKSARQELALKGIRLVIVRPGAMHTSLFSALDSYENPIEGSAYAKEFKAFVRNTTRFVGKVIKPQKAANIIFKAATSRHPRRVYRINNNPILTIMSFIPARINDWFVINLLKKGK